ncbi:hypothetical protein [Algoriphagus sediminis]|uniref:DUF4382 domain-containing protein n=1 Tax=Algoriphagus sediminis TaxID=3057113 RepID=A0ABT7YB98_9BACT|nr:hypothetical protein [Algoriphagus sediminis]MDN3203797.1 hypothetical protein [Algoriphagus sediminis]
MKKIKNISRSLSAISAVVALIFVSSCDSDSDPIVPEPDLSVVEDDVEVNKAFEDLDNLTLTILIEGDQFGARLAANQDGPICDDTDIMLDEESNEVVIDFGDGCTINGITRKGKVIFTSSRPLVIESLLFPGFSVVTTFDGYEVNGLKIEGTRTIRLQSFNPPSSADLGVEVRDGKVTWPDGSFVTYRSDQTRAITLEQGDYTLGISGSASGTSREGFDYTAVITTDLILRQSCIETGVLNPSFGVIQFNYRGIEVGLNYGFDECDNEVELTYPGGAKLVTLD